MRGKLLFITGGLIGYVLGARAGRKRYEQIASAANDLWNAKPVQRRVTEVRDFALEAVGDVPAALFNAGKKVVHAVQGNVEGTTKAASSTNAKPAAKSTPTKATPAKPAAKPAPKASPRSNAAKPSTAAGDSADTDK